MIQPRPFKARLEASTSAVKPPAMSNDTAPPRVSDTKIVAAPTTIIPARYHTIRSFGSPRRSTT